MGRTGHPATRQVASVARALSVLDALAAEGKAMGTNDVARRTGINASTVSRLLATLVAGGVVGYAAETGQYRLGVRLVYLGTLVLERLDLRTLARPHLEALVAATDETATLSLPGELSAVTIDFVQSPSSVQSVAHLGRPSVAHATATGKVMLAFGGAALPEGRLAALTHRTITDRAKLAAEVARVRRQGWAKTVGEREVSLNATAAPIWAAGGELAAILGLQGPAPRFGARAMRAALEPLLEHVASVSAALGAPR